MTLPFTGNFEVGSAVSFSYPSRVSDPNPGIRYVTDAPGQTLTLSAPVTDVAVYTRQFFLGTSTAPSFLAGIDPSLTPRGWHDDGEIVSLDTSTPIETGPGTPCRFDHWSGDVSALATLGITGPSARGFANALKQKFDAVQHDMAVPNYAAALGDLKSFINSVQPQCCTPSAGKKITSALATTLQLDALLVYHNALCNAVADNKINPSKAALDYAYYANLVSSLGGTVLPPS